MNRQKHRQEIMASVMQESLTWQGKNAMIHLSGCGIQLVSKKGRLSRTPALHLLSTHAEDSRRLTLSSSSSSFSSSSSIQDQGRSPAQASGRESENLPPRRPLKLAPLELPLEVQRQKLKSAQEVKETYPRKAKVCWWDGPDKSPERSPLSTITEPHKPLLPVNQVKLVSDRPAGKEAGQTEGNSTVRSTPAPENVCQSEHGNSQSATPAKSQDAVKRRLRLRRTQRLEEDQSKSSSSTGGLSADESKLAPACPAKGQGTAQKALRDTSHVLEKTSWRNPRD
ncbi:uncharacterized protein LOC107734030 [Sinocyclocheilus rhinocerous]|uniref:uncharacterized protein LOC107734030 n=1 Tax=Sinocyclocheilus rhinocerous TaxID=307959 RepID=UPI0007B845E4|nr:PREDICTED: uncharacterized protein LOC107734030 [Sinocyclocheilus rhinocerous]